MNKTSVVTAIYCNYTLYALYNNNGESCTDMLAYISFVDRETQCRFESFTEMYRYILDILDHNGITVHKYHLSGKPVYNIQFIDVFNPYRVSQIIYRG